MRFVLLTRQVIQGGPFLLPVSRRPAKLHRFVVTGVFSSRAGFR